MEEDGMVATRHTHILKPAKSLKVASIQISDVLSMQTGDGIQNHVYMLLV